jgi:signal transduction protein with GAF and PtsI domain
MTGLVVFARPAQVYRMDDARLSERLSEIDAKAQRVAEEFSELRGYVKAIPDRMIALESEGLPARVARLERQLATNPRPSAKQARRRSTGGRASAGS